MNGSWYAWGQQPALFIENFRQVAATVHTVPGSTMLWSPNEGGSYPFPGGPHEAKPGTTAFSALDTNGDGKLSMDDDPYSPYWPGDDAVDWVGLTLYHFGDVYPWGVSLCFLSSARTGFSKNDVTVFGQRSVPGGACPPVA